jgi:MFS transporter, DHA1 family, inner membrane transport protein
VLAVSIQTRLLQAAPGSQTLAAAANHSGLNIGNSLGAALGGAVIAAGYGYLAPAWVGLVLLVPGVALAILSGWLERRSGRRPTTDTGPVAGISA